MTIDELNINLSLYAVTDRAWTQNTSIAAQVEKAILGGVTMIQVREKTLSFDAFETIAREVQAITTHYKIPLIINDDVNLAKTIDAEGVHIGQSDQTLKSARALLGPNKIIGVSVISVEQALCAEREGADYLGVGAIFETGSKSDATYVSISDLKAICSSVSIPVVAIGGIHLKNMHHLYGTGLTGISVISAVFGSADILGAAQKLKEHAQQLHFKTPKKILTIAGSDCSGGAGIQADLKTIEAHGMYGMTVITALTAQNTLGVNGVLDTEPAFVKAKLEAIYSDMPPDAVKIGMVANPEIIRIIAEFLKVHKTPYVVLDPVMVSTSGSNLLSESAHDALVHILMPLVDCITPNIAEAEVLCGFKIENEDDMIHAAKTLSQKINARILIKGGHLKNSSNDLLYDREEAIWFKGNRIETNNTHGTGCTLSSAIACHLAATGDFETSISRAKDYVTDVLSAGLDIGQGSGPLWHSVNTNHRYY